ncbi:MAG: hypothetical protein Q7T05_06605 [Dehalococcoidia bacterium]|nr:hypothetical protein [Dehalococcoidia bacterium]
MEQVIRVTRRAADHLREVLADRSKRKEQCLRLVAVPAGTGIVVDSPKTEDKIVCVGGKPILLVSRKLALALRGATLDYQECPEGPCLTLFR